MILDTVLRAASQGIHVFPCEVGGKAPIMTRAGKLQWGREATTDPDKIRFWFTRAPEANFGIACKPSRLLVIDCDVAKDGKPPPERLRVPGVVTGEDCYAQMTIDLGVPFPCHTLTVRTPSGGYHYVYRNAQDAPLTQRPLVTGFVDVRGNGGQYGGYVVGPGSRDHRGQYRVVNRSPIMNAPDWLIRLCSPVTQPTPPAQNHGPYQQPRAAGAVGGVVDSVRYAVEGNRNNALAWAAATLAREGHADQEVFDLLSGPAMENGLGYGEVVATIRSGCRIGRSSNG